MQTERDTRPMPSWWWAAIPVLLSIVLWAYVAQHDPIDLKVYRMGGEFVWHRQASLYDLKDFWLPFTYPPFAAVVFAPLALLPPKAMIVVTYALSAAALIRIGVLAFRRVSPDLATTVAILLTPMALLLDPVVSNFSFGQVNLLLAWLVLEDLLAPQERRWRGIGIGIAAGIKLTPAIFWLLLLATKQKRAAVVAPLAGIGTVLLGFVVLPHSSLTYWTKTIFDSGRIGTPYYLSNQSYTGALARILGDHSTSLPWAVLSLVTVVVGIGACALRWRQGHVLEAVLGTELVAILVSPVSWIHHLVWAWPILLLLATAARTDVAARIIGSLWMLVTVSQAIWKLPSSDGRELTLHGWKVVAADSYTILALVTLAWIVTRAVIARRRSGPEAVPAGPAA